MRWVIENGGSVRKKERGKDRRERFLSSLTPTSDQSIDCRRDRIERVLDQGEYELFSMSRAVAQDD